MSFGFILTRHVTSEKTNAYWNRSASLLLRFYPTRQIIIIDDASNYDYVLESKEMLRAISAGKVVVVQSEYPGRGELLPYIYLLRHKYFENAVILHDSVFLHARINIEELIRKHIRVMPLWHFSPDRENVENTSRLVNHLSPSSAAQAIYNKIQHDGPKHGGIGRFAFPHDRWWGCFGCQAFIHAPFLQAIEDKYHMSRLLQGVHCRADRCCVERILGAIFSAESGGQIQVRHSLFGDIQKYQTWGYSYDNYLSDIARGKLPRIVVKVWTGR